ncbi:hypothetical protein BH18ACT12_BH18ACT12_00090 [soil metagenome]
MRASRLHCLQPHSAWTTTRPASSRASCRRFRWNENALPRLIVIGAVVIALRVFGMLLLISRSGGKENTGQTAGAILPPWRIDVTVLSGSGDINYTRQVASRIGAFGYGIEKVTRAKNFTYPQTAV